MHIYIYNIYIYIYLSVGCLSSYLCIYIHALNGRPVHLGVQAQRDGRGGGVAPRHARAYDVVCVVVLADVLGDAEVVREE